MNVVCFGQQNWDYCWTGKQQLMTRLAQRGHRVLYVDPQSMEDVSGLHDSLRALAPVTTGFGVRELAPRLFVYTHRHAPPLRWRVNHWLRPHRLAALAARLGFHDGVALAHHPSAEPLIDAVRPRARIYYAVDEATAFGTLPLEERQRIRAAEERLARDADVVLAISPRLHTRLSALQPRTYLLESAADVDHFAPTHLARVVAHPAVASLPAPRLGFVGQIDERIDQALLVALARARSDWHIVLAGRVKQGVDVSALIARPNIHLLGHQPYETLPSILREIDVCIAPYRLTPLTQACSPLKVYEYLATGRPVVATPVNALLEMRDVVSLADTPDAFRAAVHAALANPAAGCEQRLAFAARNSWDARVDELEQRFEEAMARHPGRPKLERPQRSAVGSWAGASRPFMSRHRPHTRIFHHAGTAAPTQQAARASAPTGTAATDSVDSEALSPRARLTFLVLCGAGRLYYAARVAVRIALGRRPVAVRRILVARRTRLGDLVVFLPTLRALRERYPHARIVLGVQPGMSAGALLEGSTDIDEVRVLDHLERSSRMAQLAGTVKLFAEGFDLVLSGARYFLLREALLSGAPARVGLDDGHPLQRLNTRVIPFDTTRHEADNNLALVEALTGPVQGAARIPRVGMPHSAVGGLVRLAEHLALPDHAPVLTIHPGSQKPSHRWPAERFAELVYRLLVARPALHVVFSGVSEEAPLIEAIRGALPPELRERAQNGVGHVDIPALIGLLHRSDACVSNDTGAMHLARACGTPVVALLGAEEDRRWGPYPFGPTPSVAFRYRVPCAPCVRWSCDPLFCLRSISVDEVMDAVSRLLDARQTRCDAGDRAGQPIPLERHVVTRSWEALARSFELPIASVVIERDVAGAEQHIAPAASPRADAPMLCPTAAARVVQSSGPVHRTVASIAAQSYPRIEVVVDERCGAAAHGPVIVPVRAGTVLDRDALAERVARFVRGGVPVDDVHDGRTHGRA